MLVYERGLVLPEGFNRGKVLLHFGAVDQKCRVWLNDRFVGEHEGGCLPFFFDVTQYLQAENRLRVEAEDPLDHDYPWGKQCRKRGGMWYTPVSGIWQTVWMESVPENYIEGLIIDADQESVTITVQGGQGDLVTYDRKRVKVSPNTMRPIARDSGEAVEGQAVI